MGFLSKILGSEEKADNPEQEITKALNTVAEEIEELIQKVEEEDEKLMAYEERMEEEGNTKQLSQVEQKLADMLIFFQSGVQRIEEHVQNAEVALNNVELDSGFREKAEHNVQLAKKIVSYMDEELEQIDANLKHAEHEEGRKELNELEQIEQHDEQVLSRLKKMFEGRDQYRDNPDFGWISLS